LVSLARAWSDSGTDRHSESDTAALGTDDRSLAPKRQLSQWTGKLGFAMIWRRISGSSADYFKPKGGTA
jgi:hypothetical protein